MENLARLSAVSPRVFLGDPTRNAKEHLRACKELEGSDLDVIVFPELSLTGYSCGDLFHTTDLYEKSYQAIAELLNYSSKTEELLVIGCPIKFEDKIFNCALAIQSGSILAAIPKTWIPNYREFYEARWFSSGNLIKPPTLIKLKGQDVPFGQSIIKFQNSLMRLGIEICEDLWSNRPVSDRLARNGANVIVNLSASNELVGKSDYRNQLIAASSARNITGYLYCSANSGESSSELIFSGQKISSEMGKTLDTTIDYANKTSHLITEFDLEKIDHERSLNTSFSVERNLSEIVIRKTISSKSEKLYPEKKLPFVPEADIEMQSTFVQIREMLAYALIRRVEHIKAEKIVIGISGGLDSTLAALVAQYAITKTNRILPEIIAVSLPGFGTSDRTKNNAYSLSKNLSFDFREIDIRKATSFHIKSISGEKEISEITYENTQARIRTMTLMNIANNENGLVLGTGDMSEAATGWCTYAGDHISMYHINTGIPKTLVKYLVYQFAKNTKNKQLKLILNDIIATPISPELLPLKDGQITQKTETIIGDFRIIDFCLYLYIRHGYSSDKIIECALQSFVDDFDKQEILDTVHSFFKRFFKNQFKRNNGTEGPKIGTVSLSPRGDWRMPSDIFVR